MRELEGLLIRRPIEADLEAVYELVKTCETFDTGENETTLNNIQREWQMPDFNLQTDAWLVTTPEGQIIGYGRVSDRRPVWIYAGSEIHPEYRGRGIGTYLMRLQEERARQAIVKAPAGARVVLNQETISTNPEAAQLFVQNGYELVRQFYTMEITLDGSPPAPQLPPHIQIRTFTKDLARTVFEADEEAFADHWGHVEGSFEQFQNWFLNNKTFDPTLWFLAMDGDEIAAITLCNNESPSIGWINTVATRRLWRKQGIALALLHHAFGEFYGRGQKRLGLGVDGSSLTGATRLYERAGMHIAHRYDRYQKELRPGQNLVVQNLKD